MNSRHVGLPGLAMLWVVGLGPGLSGCTILADLEDFGPGIPACDEGSDNEIRDLWLVFDAMMMHEDQLVQVRIIADGEGDDDFLVGLGVLDGLPSPDHVLYMRNAVPPGAHRIDFWADLSGNWRYDPPPTDHAWSLNSCVSGAYRFTHVPTFVDIDEPPPRPVGGDLTLRLRGFTEPQGQLLEVFVVADDTSERTVGYYRLSALPAGDATVILPGVLEAQGDYAVAFYADLSGNKRYDPPEQDHAWLVRETADASGLYIDFTHHQQFDDIDGYVPATSR